MAMIDKYGLINLLYCVVKTHHLIYYNYYKRVLKTPPIHRLAQISVRISVPICESVAEKFWYHNSCKFIQS
jgi:hypothetical protein